MELKEIRKKERQTENERRKEQMIDAAFICFSKKGMEAASISDIAKRRHLEKRPYTVIFLIKKRLY